MIGGRKELLEKFTQQEMMCCASARHIPNDAIMDIGVGLGLVAANLAKSVYSPEAVFMYESGSIDATVVGDRLPEGIDDSCIQADTPCITDVLHVLGWATMSGKSTHTLIGFAQVDKFGNVNTTCMGNYYDPDVRFPGSGGAHDFGTFSKRSLIVMIHEKRRFAEKCDYITTPGYIRGGDSRYEEGLPEGTGPAAVISTLGVFRFDPETKEMFLDTYHPGVTVEQVKENVEWDLKISPDVRETEHPTEEQIRIIRELDPDGFFLRRAELSKKIKAEAESMGWL